MGFEFLLSLLTAVPGTIIYHLLILLGLLSAAGIVIMEWRHTHSADLKPYLTALVGIMTIHLLGAMLAPFHLQTGSWIVTISAPFLYAGEWLSTLLLVWALCRRTWGRLGKQLLMGVFVGWGLLLVIASVLWYGDVTTKPLTYNMHSWQVPVWYGLAAVTAFAGIAVLLSDKDYSNRIPMALVLLLLGVGSVAGFFGSQILGAPLRNGEGLGRLFALVGYPLFAIALYRSTLLDLASYRQDLHDLGEEALRQSQELLFLIETTRSIGEKLDMSGMLERVAENVAMALRADVVALFLTDEKARDMVELVALHKLPGGTKRLSRKIALKDYPGLRAGFPKHSATFPEPEKEATPFHALAELLGVPDKGRLLVQPMTRQGHVMGILVAYNDLTKPPFTSEHGLLATTIGVQIAGAVENHRLYGAITAQAQELSQLLTLRDAELRRENAILESMAEGILVFDAQGNVVLLNRAAEGILVMQRDAVLKRSVREILSVPALKGDLDPEKLIDLSEPFEATFDLEDRWIRISAAPVLLNQGQRVGVVAILQDMTREYLAEESKREFIASISHELRTPLTAIMGYTEVMLSGMSGELPPALAQFLTVIRENAIRMASLTDNIISVAEIERGGIGLSYQKVAVSDMAHDMIERYRERIEERSLAVDVDMPDDLPSIEADYHRLQLIFDNLLSNAVKYTYANGRITVGCRAIYGTLGQPTYFSIWVSDTGVGIPSEEQANIWQRFYRVDNPLSLEAGGLGIGLTITKALVEAHGGRVWVDSTVNRGSTFTVLLPIQRHPHFEGPLG